MEFISVADVLDRGVSIGAVATEIETNGIYWWDRFGRFRKAEKIDSTSDETISILDALADLQTLYYQDITDEPDPIDCLPWEDMTYPLNRYGWHTDELPTFNEKTEYRRAPRIDSGRHMLDRLPWDEILSKTDIEALGTKGARVVKALNKKLHDYANDNKIKFSLSDQQLSRIFRSSDK